MAGEELSGLEDAWFSLLDSFPWAEAQVEGLRLRGRILFGVGAQLLGGDASEVETAGELWSLIDGARHCSDEASRTNLFDKAAGVEVRGRIHRKLRALTVLAALAVPNVRDPSSGVARGLAATHHRLTGKIPRL